MFEPTKNMSYVDGSPNNLEEFKNRQVQSTFKSNELPFNQQGLDQVLQMDLQINHQVVLINQILKYMIPKTLDKLELQVILKKHMKVGLFQDNKDQQRISSRSEKEYCKFIL